MSMSSSSSSSAGRLHGGDDDTPPQSDADAASPPPSDKLRLHICGLDDVAGSSAGANDDGDRATFFGNPCLELFLLDDRDAAAAPHQRLRDLLADACDEDALAALHEAAPPQPHQRLRDLLADAWEQDPLTALKLVCYRRTVQRGGDREGFFAAATWMLQTHPRVFVDNIPAFAELGYVQDLAQLLDRLDAAAAAEEAQKHTRVDDDAPAGLKHAREDPDAPALKRPRHDTVTGGPPPVAIPPKPINAPEPDKPPHRILYDAIVDFFVSRLRSDLQHLHNGKTSMISLAADWCPSMGSPSDKTTLLRIDIARRLFPRTDLNGDDNLVLLHLHDRVLEPLLSALHKHKPKASESAAAKPKLPHLIAGAFASEVWENKSDQQRKETTEEWRIMVDQFRAKGSLANCIAICDVSEGGLKKGNRLNVCITLGLLISELSDEPWKNCLHAFTEDDGSYSLADKTSYMEKVEAIRRMECNEKFNLRKVMEWVLTRASSNDVQPRDMVKKIFVLTGKDFEEAIVPPSDIMRAEDRPIDDFDPEDVRRWSDDYSNVCRKFKQNGYDDCVPGVVLWNLMGDRSAALTSTPKHGVMSLSGYSDDLMSLFLEKGGLVHAEDEMEAAIAGEEYQKIEVKEY